MRFPVTIALVALAAVMFFVLRDSGDDSDGDSSGGTPTAPAQPRPVIQVRGGEAVGGTRELAATKGEQASFEVRSDEALEAHLHGYDITRKIPAGGSTRFEFIADLDGIYEVEIHNPATEENVQIAELTVKP